MNFMVVIVDCMSCISAAVRLHPTPNESVPSEGEICPPLTLRVVDSYGQWAALWESQFVALNIPHLRSHTLVHTDPFNKVCTAFVLM